MPDTQASADRSPAFLRIALGLVYLHFGILKFFPDLSPAEMIASQTVMRLSGSWLDARTAMWVLAASECAIGLGFLFNIAPRWLLFVFFGHMLGTCSPLLILPELTFKIAPFAPTLEGQYIMKNLVFIAAAWTVLMPRWSFSADDLLARIRRWRTTRRRVPQSTPLSHAGSPSAPLVVSVSRLATPRSTESTHCRSINRAMLR